MTESEIGVVVSKAVTEGVKAALEGELKPFYIDRKEHYEQHQFLSELMKWTEQCKSIVLKTVVSTVVLIVIGLMAAGFALKQIKLW